MVVKFSAGGRTKDFVFFGSQLDEHLSLRTQKTPSTRTWSLSAMDTTRCKTKADAYQTHYRISRNDRSGNRVFIGLKYLIQFEEMYYLRIAY